MLIVRCIMLYIFYEVYRVFCDDTWTLIFSDILVHFSVAFIALKVLAISCWKCCYLGLDSKLSREYCLKAGYISALLH